MVGPGVPRGCGQRGAVAVRRPAQLDRQLAADVSPWLGEPAAASTAAGLGGRRTPACRAGLLLDDLDAHPAVGLHPRQHAVDLLVGGRARRTPATSRTAGSAQSGCRALAERDGDVVRPSAQTVGAGGMWVADTLGERVAERHVPGEHCRRRRRSGPGHVTNGAHPTADFRRSAVDSRIVVSRPTAVRVVVTVA